MTQPLTFFFSLLLVVSFLISVRSSLEKDVTFTALDPDNTNPADFWLELENPIPQEYVAHPRFPVVPSPGPIQMDILDQVYPNGTARPTNVWQKNLWGFAMDDYTNWGAVYPYPYIVSPKKSNVNFMYPGAPVDFNSNSHMIFGLSSPPANTTPPIQNATYPWLTMSVAYDFGVLIHNGVSPKLVSIDPLSATVEYQDGNGTVVATVYLVKGSPFINIVCTDAMLGFGSLLTPVGGKPPPIIGLNGNPPNPLPITEATFKIRVAQGPTHPQGQWWHAYFDKAVSILFPSATEPLQITSAYTGLLQIACGEVDDIMASLLDKYHGKYAAGASVRYDIDYDSNDLMLHFDWKVEGTGTDLLMLALPHHAFGNFTAQSKPEKTKFWTVKGNLWSVIGNSWSMGYNLTTVGFGDEETIDPDLKAVIEAQAKFEYDQAIQKCPGDNVTGQNIPGYKNMELYAYARDLAQHIDVSIILYNLGHTELAVNMTKHSLMCAQPILAMQHEEPQPCEPPKNNTLTCVRDQMKVFFDKRWGGLVTGWFDRFAVNYCEGCDNPTGFNPFSNYGNAFYNDHHFQYGYLLKIFAWPLYLTNVKNVSVGLNETEIHNITKQALAFARDIANPDPKADDKFPYLRHKDVFDGHSWAEGYDYSGRILTWVNQQSGGEAINSYYSLYLLGLALNDSNVRDWGRIQLATEMQSLRVYQHLSNRTTDLADIPCPQVNKVVKCLSILMGNGASGATYYGPNSQFECGITFLPVSPITKEYVDPVWAKEAVEWLEWHIDKGGLCVYPNPANMSQNPCGGIYGPNWWGNEYSCCPTNVGYPQNQWRAFPDWFPYMYILEALYDKKSGWDKLQVTDLRHPTKYLPFPYINSFGNVVGYQHDLTRSGALFTIATLP